MSGGNRFPPGWDEERVDRLPAHYEEQTEGEAVAEDEAAFEGEGHTVVEVPRELVPEVRTLIAKHRSSSFPRLSVPRDVIEPGYQALRG